MKQYIGDSVYVDSDGFHIILTTENGLGSPGNEIYLDDRVWANLKKWVKQNIERTSVSSKSTVDTCL